MLFEQPTSTNPTFSTTLTMTAGDTVDIAVGLAAGESYLYGSTPVTLVVSSQDSQDSGAPDSSDANDAGLEGSNELDSGHLGIEAEAATYLWGPLSLPNGQSWTLQILDAAPDSPVSALCAWNTGAINGPYSYGSTDATGSFALISGVGNATYPPTLASWGPFTSNVCVLYVGSSVVGDFTFTP